MQNKTPDHIPPRGPEPRLAVLERRLAKLETRERLRVRRAVQSIGLLLLLGCLVWAGTALSDPGSPTACDSDHDGLLYCLMANSPARASDINSNFEVLADGIDANAGDISTNAGDISTNAMDISTNAGDIVTLASDLAQITKMDIWRTGNNTIHFIDPGGVERTFTFDTSTTICVPTTTRWAGNTYIRGYQVCGNSFPDTFQIPERLEFNIEGVPSRSCTLLHNEDDDANKIPFFAVDANGGNNGNFGGNDNTFILRANSTGSDPSAAKPIQTNDRFTIFCI